MNGRFYKDFMSEWVPMLKLWFVMLFVILLMYIMPTTIFSHLFFYQKARGSFIHLHHHTIGSSLYGQSFSSPKYFWGRPSLTSYQTDLLDEKDIHWVGDNFWKDFEKKQELYWQQHGLSSVPEELLFPSSSQVDPHVSLQAIELQLPRILQERQISEQALRTLIEKNTEKPFFWLFGQTRVNVLKLNVALDQYSEINHGTTNP